MKSLQSSACLACLSIVVAVVASATANEKPPAPLLIETVAGSGEGGDLPPGGGEALRVSLDQPFGVEAAPHGALHITSVGQHRVLRLDPQSRKLTVVAGTGAKGYSGDGGPARDANLNEPYEVRFDAEGNLYFVEMQNHLVRRVAARGTISTLAGSGQPGYSGDDGPAAAAQFRQPHSIALDDRGFLYVADIGNHRVRRIDLATGTISSIAGNGQRELPRDGSIALGQPILGPRALAITGRTLWIALREGHSVWRLDLDSLKITHVAGTGRAGYSGDGGVPAGATFNGPKGIAATAGGLVYVVDSENQAIRLIDVAANRIYTVAGGGPQARGFGGDGGAALSAKLNRPHGICVATDGTVFIGDTNNHRVRRLRP